MKKHYDLFFGTKNKNIERRLMETLNRTPHERFLFFLKLCEEMMFFNTKKPHPNDTKNNFILK